jgi:hypothetical protein
VKQTCLANEGRFDRRLVNSVLWLRTTLRTVSREAVKVHTISLLDRAPSPASSTTAKSAYQTILRSDQSAALPCPTGSSRT